MWIDQHPSAFEWLDVTGNILFVKAQYRCFKGLG